MNKNIKKIVCTVIFSLSLLSVNAFATTATYISAAKAQEIALAQTNGGTVTRVRQEYEDRRLVYDIIVQNGAERHSMEIGASDGRIYDYEIKYTSATRNTTTAATTTSTAITAAKAKKIALARIGRGTVRKAELDRENGIMVWEVEIRDGRWEYDLEVNAQTGAIVKYDSDYDD